MLDGCEMTLNSADQDNTQDGFEERIALLREMKKNVLFYEERLLSMQGFIQALILNKEDEVSLSLDRFKADFDSFLKKFKQLNVEFSDIEMRSAAEQAELLQIAAHFIAGLSQWIVMIPQFLTSHSSLGEQAQSFLDENKALYEQAFKKEDVS